jgi:hypothetical protein
MENTSLRFAEAARILADATRSLALVAPSFRSPPRVAGDRSIRRRVGGGATVAIRYRDRPWPAVLADMVEGVVVTNDDEAVPPDEIRAALWRALDECGTLTGAPPATVRGRTAQAAAPAGRDAPTATVKPLARVA